MSDLNNIGQDMAILNITFQRQNGNMPDPVFFDLDDIAVKRMAVEAIVGGSVSGIMQYPARDGDFDNYAVDKFSARDDQPNKIVLRPKTPVGR